MNDELTLPEPATSSDESTDNDDDDYEEEAACHHPLTQRTSDAVQSLLFIGARRRQPPEQSEEEDDDVQDPCQQDAYSLTQETTDSVLQKASLQFFGRHNARTPTEESDNEVQQILVRQCEPFVPHPTYLSQVKFENTPCPPITRPPMRPAPLTTAAAIADALEVDKNESLDLDEDELDVLSAAANIGKRTKKTEDKIQNLVKRWFQTIQDHGGDILSSLLAIVPAAYSGYRTQDYAFFNILGGDKTYEKTLILDKCCILCGMKWLCLTGKTKGQPLAPVSFTKYMSTIFNEFRMKKGMTYDFRTDFNDKGQFHGVMIVSWNKIRLKDPKFGTKQHQAQFDWEADTKIRQAIKDGNLMPYEDPAHLQLVVLYVLGRMFLLRGCKEMSNLNHHDTYGGVYGREMGELAGNEYEAIQVPESKTNPLNLDNPEALSKKDQVIEVAENPFDVICAVKLLRFYKERCHPAAVKFFAKIANKKDMVQYRKEFPTKKEIWYKPSAIGATHNNIGHNKISGFMKTLGGIIGVANVEKFTNHALRGYAITKMHVARVPLTMRMKFARHSCEKSQIPYARLTNDGFIQAQLALRGVNGTTDLVEAETNNAMKESNKRKRQSETAAVSKKKAPVSVVTVDDGDDEGSFGTLSSLGSKAKFESMSKQQLVELLLKQDNDGGSNNATVTQATPQPVLMPQQQPMQGGTCMVQNPQPQMMNQPQYWNTPGPGHHGFQNQTPLQQQLFPAFHGYATPQQPVFYTGYQQPMMTTTPFNLQPQQSMFQPTGSNGGIVGPQMPIPTQQMMYIPQQPIMQHHMGMQPSVQQMQDPNQQMQVMSRQQFQQSVVFRGQGGGMGTFGRIGPNGTFG